MPIEFERIVEKALEKDRDVHQTAAELRADLRRLKRDLDSGRTSSSFSKPAEIIAKTEQHV